MQQSERDKMRAGDWYCCQDPELEALQYSARYALHVHNTAAPDHSGSLSPILAELFAGHGQNRFYRELEEWLSTFTRVSFSSG